MSEKTSAHIRLYANGIVHFSNPKVDIPIPLCGIAGCSGEKHIVCMVCDMQCCSRHSNSSHCKDCAPLDDNNSESEEETGTEEAEDPSVTEITAGIATIESSERAYPPHSDGQTFTRSDLEIASRVSKSTVAKAFTEWLDKGVITKTGNKRGSSELHILARNPTAADYE